jgi:branched-chain amino acid transport system substrate-binding protein
MEFVLTYQAAYGEKPDQIAAGGYTAGLMLQYAIETSGSIDPSLVQSTLDNADLSTFFGTIQFDQRDKYHGTQIGHELLYVQWQQNTEGKIEKKIVWPLDLAISVLVHPVP